MPFSYDKLWDILEQRNITKTQLREKIGASQTTIVNMGKNETVSLSVIEKICEALNCHPFDLMDYVPSNDTDAGDTPATNTGDIYYVDFGKSVGAEQAGICPAVIVQGDTHYPTVIVAPLLRERPIINELTQIQLNNVADPILNEYWILLEQIRAVSRARLKEKLGTIQSEDIIKIKKGLRDLFHLEKHE